MATKSPFKLIYPGQILDAVQFEENDIDLNLLDQFADMFRNGEYEMEYNENDCYMGQAMIGDSMMVVVVDITDKEFYAVTGDYDQGDIEHELPYCRYTRRQTYDINDEELDVRELIAVYMDYVTMNPERIQNVY